MRHGTPIVIAGLLLGAVLQVAVAYETLQGPTETRYWDEVRAWNGYTLFGARGTGYLIDMEGRVVNTWPVGTNPRFLDNGNLLDASTDDPSHGAGFIELDWEGNTVWEYHEDRDDYEPHHDFVRIFNTNLNAWTTFYIANKTITAAQASAAGCDPANGPYDGAQRLPNTNTLICAMTEGHIFEVTSDGELVWEYINPVTPDGKLERIDDNWPMYNSMFRAYRYTADHPALAGRDLTPGDTISGALPSYIYLADTNVPLQDMPCGVLLGRPTDRSIAVSVLATNDLDVFVEYGTQTGVYTGQTATVAVSANQPAVVPLDALAADTAYVYRLRYRAAGSGSFAAGQAYAPESPAWTYAATPATSMYSEAISGCQRLPNGNTLICDGTHGELREVTSAGQVVWFYTCPVQNTGPMTQGETPALDIRKHQYNALFKVRRYPATYAGLQGKDLTPRGTIELYPGEAVDADGDTMADVWEVALFGSTTVASLMTDNDGDDLPDAEENRSGLRPDLADTDGDGAPDGWEADNSLNPAYAVDGLADADGDGMRNADEYVADTEPLNPLSLLAVTRLAFVNDGIHITWTGGVRAQQHLECSSNLVSGRWRAVFTNLPPTAPTNVVIRNGAEAGGAGFYRIKVIR